VWKKGLEWLIVLGGNRPDYGVFVSQKARDDKNFYTRPGAAWKARDALHQARRATDLWQSSTVPAS
jgi:hypothetical protein